MNPEQKQPIIMTSEPARKKFQDNLLKLQNMEMMYQPQPAPIVSKTPKPTQQNFA